MKFKNFSLLLLLSFFVNSCLDNKSMNKEITSFRVSLTSTPSCGLDSEDECLFSLEDNSFSIDVKVEALLANRSINTNFNSSVIVSVVPSGIFDRDDPNFRDLPDGRDVIIIKLVQGVWEGQISFKGAFGPTSIIAEDVGYEPAANVSEATCYQKYTQGCFAVDDDNPLPGSGAAGVSNFLYFDNPRIYDIQRPEDLENIESKYGDYSPLEGFRVQVDGSPYQGNQCAAGESRLVVTQVGVAGLYVTDVCNRLDPNNPSDPIVSDFASLYIYNFNTPEELSIGDCLLSFQGSIDEFQSFTEMKNPFWTVDECTEEDDFCEKGEPKCTGQLPAPVELNTSIFNDFRSMEELEASLVKVTNVVSNTEFRRCDLNNDGIIDFDDDQEDQCKDDCGTQVDCVVKEDFDQYFTWTVDMDGVEVGIVTRGVVPFDPEDPANQGINIHSITGNLKHLYFGKPAWIILPRTPSDLCINQSDCQ
ncbi:MAG: hypothetical protein PF689_04225 [Deltaproteobacteria bacterium]|jgi:hypothetical protein|nr:hypothetical protein [Deltaproteobacteria bacterium]